MMWTERGAHVDTGLEQNLTCGLETQTHTHTWSSTYTNDALLFRVDRLSVFPTSWTVLKLHIFTNGLLVLNSTIHQLGMVKAEKSQTDVE